MKPQLFATAASALSGPITNGSGRCGAPPPSYRHLMAAKQMAAEEAAVAPHRGGCNSAPVNINVHWHTIAANTTYEGGYVDESDILAQIDVLNEIYPQHGFTFNLSSTDWSENAGWALLETFDQALEMKQALRRGSYADLNVYTLLLPDGLLGISASPDANVTVGSEIFTWDGVIMAVGSMPGGIIEHYNLGYTAVHEIGHWLGLIHPFQGGCEGDNDFINDTPAESTWSSGCPIGRDTCPSPGEDPIHNFMDYSYDECLTEFTPGQAVRMKSVWKKFRSPYSN